MTARARHEQRAIERPGWYRFEIVGAVERGGAVVVGRADLLQIVEIVAVQILGAVEHQMLEQMGEAGLALGLVLGADIVPDAHGHHRRLMILVNDDGEAIVENELGVGDRDFANQRSNRHRFGRRSGSDGRDQVAGGGGFDRRARRAGGEQRYAGQQDSETTVNETHGGFGNGVFVVDREVPVYVDREVPVPVPVAVEPPAPAVPREAYVIGKTYASLPQSCMKLIEEGVSFYYCSGEWYRQVGEGRGAMYKAVKREL